MAQRVVHDTPAAVLPRPQQRLAVGDEQRCDRVLFRVLFRLLCRAAEDEVAEDEVAVALVDDRESDSPATSGCSGAATFTASSPSGGATSAPAPRAAERGGPLRPVVETDARGVHREHARACAQVRANAAAPRVRARAWASASAR
jgi:hypothetical protein